MFMLACKMLTLDMLSPSQKVKYRKWYSCRVEPWSRPPKPNRASACYSKPRLPHTIWNRPLNRKGSCLYLCVYIYIYIYIQIHTYLHGPLRRDHTMSAAAMDAAVSKGPSLQEIQLVQGHVRRCQHQVGFRNLLVVLIVQKVGERPGCRPTCPAQNVRPDLGTVTR